LAWSAWHPFSYFIWILEVAAAIVGALVLIAIYPRFKFTDLVYVLVLVHAIILMIGGHYTYAEMPLLNWLRDEFHLARNHYDRVGHLAQGFVPAIIAREVLIRRSPLKPGKWLFLVVTCFCLALSAFYEFIEWVGRHRHRRGGDGLPGHAGRHLGHAMGYVLGVYRCERCATPAQQVARPAACFDADRLDFRREDTKV